MTKTPLLIILLLCCSGIVVAQPAPRLCLPDTDGDGHPLFGNPQIRPGFEETVGGELRVGNATSVAFADLDGDGDLDAAVTNTGRTTVFYITVLINRGDGVFDPPVRYDAGAEPIHIVAADLDGDGVPDLAVANATSNDVSVFINNGDGTFADDVKHATGTMPRSLVTADFDGDGDGDIATLNTESNDVSVFINLGDGTFAPEQRVPVGGVTQIVDVVNRLSGPQLACGDLNGDGEADLAVPAIGGRIKLLFGDGLGGFTLAAQHAGVPNGSYAVVMGDLDGDGDNDLATVAAGGNESLSVVLNRGGGVFDPAVAYNVAVHPSPGALHEPRSLALGDLEGDGDLDIAVGYDGRHLISVFRNNGDGSYAPKETHPVHPGPWFVAWADVNGDGAADLAVLATGTRSKLAVLLNDGDGGLIAQEPTPPRFVAQTTSIWISPTSVAAADLDGDGDQDLAVSIGATQDPSTVTVMFNDGNGAFDPIVPYTLGPVGESSAEHVAIEDLNQDGILDLVVADKYGENGSPEPGNVWVLLGTGGGGFGTAKPYPIGILTARHVAVGDLDGDGDKDLAIWAIPAHPGNNTTPVDRKVVVMLNDGQGRFRRSSGQTIGSPTWLSANGAVSVGDLDSDGDLDIVATVSPSVAPGSVVILLNDGLALFAIQPTIQVAPHPISAIMIDADRDGDLDIAVGHNHRHRTALVANEPYLTILLNDGVASFPDRREHTDPFARNLGRLTIADMNGDGYPDLIQPATGNVLVNLVNGEKNFGPGVRYGSGGVPTGAAVADFDGDGRADIVTANSSDHNITLLRNLGCPTCYADCDQTTGVGVLDLRDFLCFQTAFISADPYACDCDTSTGPLVCDIIDFLCFQNAFVAGCP